MASAIETAIQNFRTELLSTESQATRDVLSAYADVRGELVQRIQALADEIAKEGRALTPGEVFRMERAQELLRQVETEMARLAGGANGVIVTGQETAVVLAGEHSQGLAAVSAIGDARATAVVTSAWNHLPAEAVASMVGRLSDGSPLADWLGGFGDDTRTRLNDALTKGVALGQNPRTIAAQLEGQVDLAGARLLTVTRTEILRSYREAQRISAVENQDILSGVMRIASLSDTTCGACLALHQTTYEVGYVMDDHPNCRCNLIPLVKDVPTPEVKSGEEFFDDLKPEQQDRILGSPSAGIAYRSGSVKLEDFVHRSDDPQWGPGARLGSLTAARENATSRESGERRAA